MLKIQVGSAIKAARVRKGFTMQSLADAMGVDRVTVTRYESGRMNLSIDLIERIAKALDVEVKVLLQDRS